MKNKYTIARIGGDGIGPEMVEQAVAVLEKTPISWNWVDAEAGFDAYTKQATPLPQKTLDVCSKADAILFGAVTTPPHIENYKSPIVALRKHFNLFANIRPVKSMPIDISRGDIDMLIVRENTEDLYGGNERAIEGGAIAERVITTKASERIVKTACELAIKRRKKLHVIHKANVLRMTDGLFLQSARNVLQNYPQLEFVELLVDACAMQLIKNPGQFDVIVTTNMFGDILSDEASALVGGLGVASSANINESFGLFEPVHGSAPKYTGTNTANPLATILASTLMLDFLKETEIATAIRNAVFTTLEKGKTTKDLGGTLSTTEFTKEIISTLQI